MNNIVRLAIVDPNDSTRAALKNMLLGIDRVWLEAECSRYEFFTDVVVQSEPQIAMISLDSDAAKGLELIAQIRTELPNCCVLVTSSSQEGSLILQAMRNGAREFLNVPLKLEDFMAALDRLQNASGGGNEGQVRGSRVISVAGVCGGVGCTSLAINLGCMLSQDPANTVAIVDLDLSLGDADVWLDIIPDYTIQDVAENISRIDYSLLKRSLTKHECGAYLLPRPVQMDDVTAITPDELRRVVGLLKATFTHVIVDLSKSYTPLDMAAMESSDLIFLVTQLDLPCLRNVVRLLQFFEADEALTEKIRVIVNRLGLEDTQISMNKAVETIGREIYWQIPNDYITMVESRNNGIPLFSQAPKSKLTRSLQQLAALLDERAVTGDESEEKRKKKGLFKFLSAGAK